MVTVACPDSVECVTGSFRYVFTMVSTSLSSVAENSSRWPSAGVMSSSVVTAGMKPMSHMWSASSRTAISTAPRSAAPCSHRSISRPGVAISRSTPRRSASICFGYGRPPAISFERHVHHVRERLERVVHLHGELTRRDQHHATRAAGLGVTAGETHQRRQAETERFAGAGLAAAEHVLAGQRVRDGRGLDRERRGDAVPGQPLDQPRRESEGGELVVRGNVAQVLRLLVALVLLVRRPLTDRLSSRRYEDRSFRSY